MNTWRTTFGQARSRWQRAGWCLAFAFPVLALVVDKAASTIFAIFFLAGLWLLVRGRVTRPTNAKWVLIAFAAYFIVGTLSFFLGEQTRLGEQLLGRDIRFFGAVAVFFALARLAVPEKGLRASFVAGGFATGAYAIVEVILASHPDYRAGGETISIVFGHLAAMLFAVLFAIALFEKKGGLPAWFSTAFALAAVTLSSTRGALLAVLAVLAAGILLAVMMNREWRRPGRLAGISVIVIGAAAVAGWALLPRFEDGFAEFRAYLQAADGAPVRVSRDCLDRKALERQLEFSRAQGLAADIVARDAMNVPGCSANTAIRLVNATEKSAYWVGPYRNLPEGAGGRIRLQGKAGLKLEGSDERLDVTAEQPRVLALPQVSDIEHTRLVVRVAPGERALLVPIVTRPGEYAYAAADTPVGSRLAMWAAAWRRFDGSLLGAGAGAWPAIMAEEARANRAPWRLSAYDHAHSDYLTVLVERGWLGLLALAGLLAAPFAQGWRMSRGGDWRGPAAMLLVTSVAVSALTETVFNHSIGITYYCALVLLLLTARTESVS